MKKCRCLNNWQSISVRWARKGFVLSEKKIEIEISDSSLRWAITEFIQNLNVLMSPIVQAIKNKPKWIQLWREGETIPDGYCFMGDDKPRNAHLWGSATYSAEDQIGKITIEVIESNMNPYPMNPPARKHLVFTLALAMDNTEVIIAQAQEAFTEQAKDWCKAKNDEAQS